MSAVPAVSPIAAGYFELALPFAVLGLVTALNSPPRRIIEPVLWSAATCLLASAELLTYSRGALVGMSAGVVVLGFCSYGSSPFRLCHHWPWAVAISVSVALVVALLLSSTAGPGLLRVTTASDLAWYNASYSASSITTMRPSQVIEILVTVTNRGALTWVAGRSNEFRLSYHWLKPSGSIALFNGVRTPFGRDIHPGERVTVRARVQAPARRGQYLLVWDTVQEGIVWFDVKTGRYQGQTVDIAGLPIRHPEIPVRADTGPRVLPTAPLQPDRRQLWSTAGAMIRAHPLFGVGPDG